MFITSFNETLMHVDHCIDMLRQVLMCNADTGVVTFSWVSCELYKYPPFLLSIQFGSATVLHEGLDCFNATGDS